MSLPPLTAPPPSSSLNPNSTFITRTASTLYLGSSPYVVAGPNIYWLGIDENDPPGSVTYPSRQRVLEVLATAYAMGANTVRSTTLGVSVGCDLCVWPRLGVINGQALQVVDFAVWAARLYGLRLVIPLVDNYEYYHGGIYSFLQFHNLSTDDYSPFYDTSSAVYDSFLAYITTILNHTNPYTGLRLSQDPTILAWESGNELGGWGGSGAPASWTAALAQFVKSDLGAKQLFIDGSYGIVRDALGIGQVDIVSNHHYPPYTSKLFSDARTALAADKAYLAGEFDWVSHGSSPRMWALVAGPALLALLVFALPGRWFPWPIRYGCLYREKRKRAGSAEGVGVGAGGARQMEMADQPETDAEDSPPPLRSSPPPSSRPAYPELSPRNKMSRPSYKRQDTERAERWRLFEDGAEGKMPFLERIGTGTGMPFSPPPAPPSSAAPPVGSPPGSPQGRASRLSQHTPRSPSQSGTHSHSHHIPPTTPKRPLYTPTASYRSSHARTPSPLPSLLMSLKPLPAEREPHTFLFRKWHFALVIFLLLTPAVALLLHFLLPSTISSFTSALASTPGVSGGLYWSLFGHTDTCTSYVYHGDGYWLVYPGQGGFMSYRVGQLVVWERGVSGYGLQAWGDAGEPTVACKQAVNLSLLPNVSMGAG
ncbi:glycoside hydrolase [Dacryopinax primogenitus]|uniref:mannan endo-1,4-beta-mannosidase n=1 Tax=Dacryopinax primogenitus (strain DJM 731) TaxID=1858805 RepID=M5G806_DACPD|nr:glycoside hydrolase [Dacryopinax primogenitus]EJU02007.1 glycoside hydrolase [Dacryopinax primogenitus]